MPRLTKIIATMGPAVASAQGVRNLVSVGMDVARLNFSHGEHQLHHRFAQWVRQAAEDEGRVVALLQDIQGPKLRVGSFPEGSMQLDTGSEVLLQPGTGEAEPGSIQVGYDQLVEDVDVGEEILVADGMIRLEVVGKSSEGLQARVVLGGTLGSGKGVAFPHTRLQTPAITIKDRIDLEYGQELGVDYVAASFVRTGEDLGKVRELAGGVPVIAKIELASGYHNLDSILEFADGAMVARGDLGVQLPLERIPIIQADIIHRTNRAGLISITATEMLESMTHSPRPTRAEVTDVANSVIEGTDAVMLSAETATGDYPTEAVATMARICESAETMDAVETAEVDFLTSVPRFGSAVAKAAVKAAEDLSIKTIVAFTEAGGSPRLLSKYRPQAQIIGFTPEVDTLRKMALYRGVQGKLFGRRDYTDLMIAAAEKFLEKEKICERGEAVIMVAGIPPNVKASTNLMKIHTIGERDRGVPSAQTGRTTPEFGTRPRGKKPAAESSIETDAAA